MGLGSFDENFRRKWQRLSSQKAILMKQKYISWSWSILTVSRFVFDVRVCHSFPETGILLCKYLLHCGWFLSRTFTGKVNTVSVIYTLRELTILSLFQGNIPFASFPIKVDHLAQILSHTEGFLYESAGPTVGHLQLLGRRPGTPSWQTPVVFCLFLW